MYKPVSQVYSPAAPAHTKGCRPQSTYFLLSNKRNSRLDALKMWIGPGVPPAKRATPPRLWRPCGPTHAQAHGGPGASGPVEDIHRQLVGSPGEKRHLAYRCISVGPDFRERSEVTQVQLDTLKLMSATEEKSRGRDPPTK
jgi:hypothetical protein